MSNMPKIQRLVVRIADTNSEDIYEPAYNMIIKDAEWITQQKSTSDSVRAWMRYYLMRN